MQHRKEPPLAVWALVGPRVGAGSALVPGQVDDVNRPVPNRLAVVLFVNTDPLYEGRCPAVLGFDGMLKFWNRDVVHDPNDSTVFPGSSRRGPLLSVIRFIPPSAWEATVSIERPVFRSLRFARYNFVRLHKSLRVTPAMAAGVSDRLWTLEELVEQTSK